MEPRFRAGDAVRVRQALLSGHHRTPAYVQGRTGIVERIHGAYPNPETRAYGAAGLLTPLYLVRFRQSDLWDERPERQGDSLFIDLYEGWLEAV